MSKIVVVIDFETTGRYPKNGARAIEVGAVKIKDNKIIDTFDSLMNPKTLLPSEISFLTGITQDMLDNAPTNDKIIPKLVAFLGNADELIAHNAPFDKSMLETELHHLGISKEYPFTCSLKMARKHFPDLEKHSLEYLVDHLNLKKEKTFHRALDDALMTTELWLKMQKELSSTPSDTDTYQSGSFF